MALWTGDFDAPFAAWDPDFLSAARALVNMMGFSLGKLIFLSVEKCTDLRSLIKKNLIFMRTFVNVS